ncbi:lipopolysaccharide biosynthesis protein [Bizionia sediminis]|uniref:Lipopolysaccharide biosynthesis protein n=1 Tax=Bizionia sediminis TaxID=1737064 RepID=A0ABW5KV60_9FLAO
MSLKKQTFTGIIWTFADTFFVRGFSFVTMILLARWIGPTDFGLIGMIAVFIAVGKTLTDSGLTSSLIRTKKPSQADFSTVFFVNIAMSLIVFFVIFTAAPVIADFFGYPILIDIIRVYCVVFIITAFSAVQLAILNKDMKFKKITKINLPSTLIGSAVGLYLGFNGYGVWSIVWMFLTIESIKASLLWLASSWKPKAIFSKAKFKYHYNFGYKLLLSGLLDTVFKNIYNVLIGKFFSAQTLGYYERSKQFSEYPSATLTGVIGSVTYPMLSKIQDDSERLERVYRKLIRISFFVIAPLMLGAAAVAEPLFLLILGKEWLPAVLFFQILSLAMMLYPIHAYNLNILKVYGRSDLFLKLEIIKKSITTIAVIVAFQFDVLGLVWASVFTSFAALGVNMFYASKLIKYSIPEQMKDLVVTLFIALLMAVAMNTAVQVLSDTARLIQIAVATIIGISSYLGMNYVIKSSPLHQAILLLKSRNL